MEALIYFGSIMGALLTQQQSLEFNLFQVSCFHSERCSIKTIATLNQGRKLFYKMNR